MIERRRSQRVEPPQRLRARVKNANGALVLDVSPHGALLQTSAPLGPRSECNVILALETGDLRLRGIVRRCRARVDESGGGLVYRAGLEFLDLERGRRECLEEALVELLLTEIEEAGADREAVVS